MWRVNPCCTASLDIGLFPFRFSLILASLRSLFLKQKLWCRVTFASVHKVLRFSPPTRLAVVLVVTQEGKRRNDIQTNLMTIKTAQLASHSQVYSGLGDGHRNETARYFAGLDYINSIIIINVDLQNDINKNIIIMDDDVIIHTFVILYE